jgi:hypothetical protein
MGNRRMILENILVACAYGVYAAFVWASDTRHTSVHLIVRHSSISLGGLETVLQHRNTHELVREVTHGHGLLISVTTLLQAGSVAGAVGAVLKAYTLLRAPTGQEIPDELFAIEWLENAVVHSALSAAIYLLFGGLEETMFVILVALCVTSEFAGFFCEVLVSRGTPSTRAVNATLGLCFYGLLKACVAGIIFSGISSLQNYEPVHHFSVMATFIFYTVCYGVFTFSKTVCGRVRNVSDLSTEYIMSGRTALLFTFSTSQIWQMWALVTSALMRDRVLTATAADSTAQPLNVSFIMTVVPLSLCTLYLFASFPVPSQVKKTDNCMDTPHHAVAIFSQRAQSWDGGSWEQKALQAPSYVLPEQKKSKSTKKQQSTYKISFTV